MPQSSKLSLRQRVGLEIERAIRHNQQQLHPLQQLFWESTLRCNLHCLHCGSDCKTQSIAPDMPLEDFLHVLDSITPHVNPNKVMIIVSGGEPLMRTDLEACGMTFHQRGYPWGMVSNGLALTPKRYAALLDAGLSSITISLDGLQEQHNWLRGHPQSFNRASEAIRMIAATEDIAWDVVTCVTPRTLPLLPEIKEYLLSLGVTHWRIFTIAPMGRAKGNAELLTTPSDFIKLMRFIEQTRAEGRIACSYACEGFLGNYEGKVRDHLFHCAAGLSVASVLIDGSISACTSIRGKYYQGNIYKDDFWTVWENGFKPYRDRSWMRKAECADCRMFRYCEGGGMHLRDEQGDLLHCYYHALEGAI